MTTLEEKKAAHDAAVDNYAAERDAASWDLLVAANVVLDAANAGLNAARSYEAFVADPEE